MRPVFRSCDPYSCRGASQYPDGAHHVESRGPGSGPAATRATGFACSGKSGRRAAGRSGYCNRVRHDADQKFWIVGEHARAHLHFGRPTVPDRGQVAHQDAAPKIGTSRAKTPPPTVDRGPRAPRQCPGRTVRQRQDVVRRPVIARSRPLQARRGVEVMATQGARRITLYAVHI